MSTQYKCAFQHWRWEIPEDVLSRYGSRSFSRPEAGNFMLESIRNQPGGAEQIISEEHYIPDIAIIGGNEAYPESAIADPISDLIVWHDWKTGKRRFPYPGVYAPLDMKVQGSKIAASSVIGVIGEILTGIYAQSGIGYTPIVRVIRRWPDFIFSNSRGFHYVEAKGTIEEHKPGSPLTYMGNHASNLREILLDALQQLNADPHVPVWGGFVGVNITASLEIQFTTTFLELLAPTNRKLSATKTCPQLVIKELAKRSLARALPKICGDDVIWQVSDKYKRRRIKPMLDEKKLVELSLNELDKLLETESLEAGNVIPVVEGELDKMIGTLEPAEDMKTGRIDRIKAGQFRKTLPVRRIGDNVLITVALSDEEHKEYFRSWTGEWNQVQSTINHNGHQFFRAGGSLYGLIPFEDEESFLNG